MYPDVNTIKTILLKENYIAEADSKAAEAASHDSAGFVEFLIRQQLLTKPLLGQALAEHYKMPFADLTANPVSKETIEKIPEATAKAQRVIFVKASDQVAAVATDKPEGVDLAKIAPFFPGKKVRLA